MTIEPIASTEIAGAPEVGLEADRALLDRSSTTERVARILRSRIAEGFFRPGSRLSEDGIAAALSISRNTLREAFRVLTHEGLVVHQLHRGVFVRMLSVEDVIDLYRVRKVIECAAVRSASPTSDLEPLAIAVQEGEAAAQPLRWQELGTANIHFHQAVVHLCGSLRLDSVMEAILAELRLVFHVMPDPDRFFRGYLAGNRKILATLQAGDAPEAERTLRAYLDVAERELVAAYATVVPGNG